MAEPSRIGLTREADAYLDEMLDFLNAQSGGPDLIKFDLYRLAVALGIKKGVSPAPLSGATDPAFRVAELDPDKALYYVVEAADLKKSDEAIYHIVERLADQGIRQFYTAYKENMGNLPWDKLLV